MDAEIPDFLLNPVTFVWSDDAEIEPDYKHLYLTLSAQLDLLNPKVHAILLNMRTCTNGMTVCPTSICDCLSEHADVESIDLLTTFIDTEYAKITGN
jgi:hypothetical protein